VGGRCVRVEERGVRRAREKGEDWVRTCSGEQRGLPFLRPEIASSTRRAGARAPENPPDMMQSIEGPSQRQG
jgi:hypothetical protein